MHDVKPTSPAGQVPDRGFWAPVTLPPGARRGWRAGALRLWVERSRHAWHVATARDTSAAGASGPLEFTAAGEPPADAQRQTWVAAAAADSVRLEPALPPRPIVVLPPQPTAVLPGGSLLCFIPVPVWLRIRLGSEAGETLGEEAAEVLSSSWLGDPVEGELCYSLRAGLERDAGRLPPDGHRVICPLRIRNEGTTTLRLDRFCLRVPHLDIFLGASRLWANTGAVVWHGEEIVAQFHFEDGPPSFEPGCQRLAAAREKPLTGVLARAFHDVRALASRAG
jgi:hypothetical protein